MQNNENLIVVRQLPVIEDQLRQIKQNVELRVGEALSMACTEETRQSVKEARTVLNREFGELEARRKEVKAAIMAPYDAFEKVYKECAADIYRDADAKLKARIDEVETGLKRQKAEKVKAYFEEYRQSLGISAEYVPFYAAGINITLSASEKSLKTAAKAFLDRVSGELRIISTQERSDEILVEYLRDLDLPRAISTVDRRHKAMAAERERRQATAEQAEARDQAAKKVEAVVAEEPVMAPPAAVMPPEEEKEHNQIFSTAFKVTGTIDQLRALKQFLTDGGFEYEQL
ncbi:DUF1351 domain-containing protein [Flavonifractor sp. An100]|uniref:DUF1351 domain-containing protein n=1 Tax=Flavonifractor sp. An100 TaxID=1965538 RepID=UPI000B38A953|nr:DUF1351 domain-containing protein [Flavonifractor sp. An100]OUQ79129.1 hypothetical protein B5E43_06205 [Flavonifractor sp. An100]